MKFIFVWVTVCTIVLNLNVDFANTQVLITTDAIDGIVVLSNNHSSMFPKLTDAKRPPVSPTSARNDAIHPTGHDHRSTNRHSVHDHPRHHPALTGANRPRVSPNSFPRHHHVPAHPNSIRKDAPGYSHPHGSSVHVPKHPVITDDNLAPVSKNWSRILEYVLHGRAPKNVSIIRRRRDDIHYPIQHPKLSDAERRKLAATSFAELPTICSPNKTGNQKAVHDPRHHAALTDAHLPLRSLNCSRINATEHFYPNGSIVRHPRHHPALTGVNSSHSFMKRSAAYDPSHHTSLTDAYIKNTMTDHFIDVSLQHYEAFHKCKLIYNIPHDEAYRILLNTPWDHHNMSHETKCFAKCFMYSMGVISERGFEPEVYVRQVKQFMFSYTSFDMSKESDETKRLIREAIAKQLESRVVYKEFQCFIVNPRNYKDSENNTLLPPNTCSKLIRTYEVAAHRCKNVLTRADSCLNAWDIINCIYSTQRRRDFTGPFYPGPFIGDLLI